MIELSEMLRGWRRIDTSLVEKITDEQLLDRIETIPLNGGWGLLAELMKRYARLKGIL